MRDDDPPIYRQLADELLFDDAPPAAQEFTTDDGSRYERVHPDQLDREVT